MSGPCYGFKGDPDDIEVKVGGSEDAYGNSVPAVIIDDPKLENVFCIHPESARMRADLIEETAKSNRCLQLANEIRKIADRVEELKK